MGSNSYFGMRLPAFYSLGRKHFTKRKIKPIQIQKDGRRLVIQRWISHCMPSSPPRSLKTLKCSGWGGDNSNNRSIAGLKNQWCILSRCILSKITVYFEEKVKMHCWYLRLTSGLFVDNKICA